MFVARLIFIQKEKLSALSFEYNPLNMDSKIRKKLVWSFLRKCHKRLRISRRIARSLTFPLGNYEKSVS